MDGNYITRNQKTTLTLIASLPQEFVTGWKLTNIFFPILPAPGICHFKLGKINLEVIVNTFFILRVLHQPLGYHLTSSPTDLKIISSSNFSLGFSSF
jgi:hypothetical protein